MRSLAVQWILAYFLFLDWFMCCLCV